MSVATMWRLLWWAKKEKSQRKIELNDLLNEIRAKIDNQVLSEEKSFHNVTNEPTAKNA
jgi:hypothetical protein